jgi:hypothetical protein
MILKTSKINGVGGGRKNRAEKYLMLQSELPRLRALSDYYPVRALVYAQEALTDAEKQIKFNGVFPQCLEVCMANIIALNNK